MRLSSLLIFSALFTGAVGCGSDAEVCDDNADNDGDQTVDCDDPDCAADAACEDAGDEEDEASGPEDCSDILDGNDEDDDGDVNCEDSDCVGTEYCDEVLAVVELGEADITSTAWTGTGSYGYQLYALEGTTTLRTPVSTGCAVSFTSTGAAHEKAADCEGCTFAFEVGFSASQPAEGDHCDGALALVTEDGSPVSLDGASYGYGYNPTYEYNGQQAPAMMYFGLEEGAWGAATLDVAFENNKFEYAWAFGYGYY